MNRQDRRRQKAENRQHLKTLPEKLEPQEVKPHRYEGPNPPIAVWLSRYFLVQIFDETSGPNGFTLHRMTVCRSEIRTDGRWKDNITWDELQQIKREVGYGEWSGVEIYPADRDVVNVANMRHIWLTETPLNIGWRKSEGVV